MKVYNDNINNNDFEYSNMKTNLISDSNEKKDIERKLSNLSDFYFNAENQDQQKKENEIQKENFFSNFLNKSQSNKNNDIKGLIILIFSVFMWSVTNLFSKHLSIEYPKLENLAINFFRGIFLSIYSLIAIYYLKIPYIEEIKKSRSKFSLLIFRCFFGATANVLLFACFRHMRISSGFTIFCTYPLFVSIILVLYLKSSFCCSDFLSYILCSLAVVFISKPAFVFGENNIEEGNVDSLFGVFLAFLSAISNAIGIIINKNIALDFHYLSSALFFGVFFIVDSIIFLPFTEYGISTVNFYNLIWIITLSFTFFIGLCGFVIALNIGNPVKILPGSYSGIVFTLFYNAFIFNNSTDFLDLLGTGIIILFNVLGSLGIKF